MLKHDKQTNLFYYEAYGFKSMPFQFEDMRENKNWFSELINGEALGTIQ